PDRRLGVHTVQIPHQDPADGPSGWGEAPPGARSRPRGGGLGEPRADNHRREPGRDLSSGGGPVGEPGPHELSWPRWSGGWGTASPSPGIWRRRPWAAACPPCTTAVSPTSG